MCCSLSFPLALSLHYVRHRDAFHRKNPDLFSGGSQLGQRRIALRNLFLFKYDFVVVTFPLYQLSTIYVIDVGQFSVCSPGKFGLQLMVLYCAERIRATDFCASNRK